jgi:hypothetical protein
MKIMFKRWSLDPKGRTTVAVESKRVDCVEHLGDAYGGERVAMWWQDDRHDQVPAASKIIMQGKQEYLVQGTVEEVTDLLNLEGEIKESKK